MFLPFHDDNPTRRPAVLTYVIIAINVLALVWYNRLPPPKHDLVTLQRGFIPCRIRQLYDPRPIIIPQRVLVNHGFWGPQVLNRQVILPPDRREILVSLVTCMFLHGGWLHLIGNMWFLWLFGNNVEDRLGPGVFVLFYLVGGFIASACHWAISPMSFSPVIGASGAVAAVLGAYAITWPWARIHTLVWVVIFITIIDVPALVVLGAWFLMQLFSAHGNLGLNAPGGVAWWAPVGGFLAGMGMMPVLSWLLGADRPSPLTAEVVEEQDG